MLESVSTERHLWESTCLWLQLGFALMHGNLRKGYLASQNAYLMAKNLGDIPLQLHALIANFAALTHLGEFPAAEKTGDMIERLLGKQDYPELRALHLLFYTRLSICSNKLDRARESLDSARREFEEHGLMYHHPRVTLYEILLRRLIGEYAEAEQQGRQALNMARQMGNPYVMGTALMELGTTAYYKGDPRQAVALLERAIVVFPRMRVNYRSMPTCQKSRRILLCATFRTMRQATRSFRKPSTFRRYFGLLFPGAGSSGHGAAQGASIQSS